MVRCSNCHQPIKDSELGWHNIMCNKSMSIKEHKMTREEAIEKCLDGLAMKPIELGDIKVSQLIDMLEKLGLLKFEEKKNVSVIFTSNYQDIRLEEWSEGLVLWIGGEVVWKSWIAYAVMGEKFPR